MINNDTAFKYFSDIVFYQLVATYSNESEQDIAEKIAKVQLFLYENVDKSKVKEYINRSIQWVKEGNNP